MLRLPEDRQSTTPEIHRANRNQKKEPATDAQTPKAAAFMKSAIQNGSRVPDRGTTTWFNKGRSPKNTIAQTRTAVTAVTAT